MRSIKILLFIICLISGCQFREDKMYNYENYVFQFSDSTGLIKFYAYRYDTSYKMLDFYWDKNKLQSRTFIKNNKRDGPSIIYGDNGLKWSVSNFKDGKLNGKEITFGENGDTVSIAEYKNGVKVK